MDGARDFGAITVSFAAGVALAALGLNLHWIIDYSLLGAISLLLSVLLMALILRSGQRPFTASLFFMLGIFCWSTAMMRAQLPDPETRLCTGALLRLKALISSIPFENESSRSLVIALISGDKNGLDQNSISAFRKAGASHILALSGLHLGMIYLFIARSLSILGNGWRMRMVKYLIIIALTLFYTMITGAGPSIVRAFLFIFLRESAQLLPERKLGRINTFLTALTIQLALNPMVINSLGFQLSYLAMLGIVVLFPWLDSWYPDDGIGFNPIRKIWTWTSMSLSCQLFTAPLIWFKFSTFPQYFLITNLIAMPLTGGIMFLTILCIIAASLDIHIVLLTKTAEYLIGLLCRALEIISNM